MPASRARARLASLRPSSEVRTCRPFSVSRLPTAAPIWPCAMTATVGFMFGSFQLPDVGCQMSDVRCRMSDVGCRMSDVRCQMSDVRCQMSDVGVPMHYLLIADL